VSNIINVLVSDEVVFKHQVGKFSAISWWDQIAFRWDDNDDVHFSQDQNAEMDFL
jgi:hypothetical protein